MAATLRPPGSTACSPSPAPGSPTGSSVPPPAKKNKSLIVFWFHAVERARGARLIDCVLQESWTTMVGQLTGLSLCTGALGTVLLLFLFSLRLIFPMEVVRTTGAVASLCVF